MTGSENIDCTIWIGIPETNVAQQSETSSFQTRAVTTSRSETL
jgi:hypothetical protein